MATPQDNKFSLDASSLIFAWFDAYPPDAFETFWNRLDGLAHAGRVLVSEEVYEELRRKDDGLFAWVKQRTAMVVPHEDEVQRHVSAILNTHPLLIKARSGRSGGDPFVIGVALAKGCAVVTQEGPGSPTTPKIPDVCRAYNVPCHPLRDLIRGQGWRF